jgi:WD40 repeat protein
LPSSDSGGTIYALTFTPKNWFVAGTDTSTKAWDLDNKNGLDELQSNAPPKTGTPWRVSASWSADVHLFFACSADGKIYGYEIGHAA